MKTKISVKRILSALIVVALCFTMCLLFTGCKDKTDTETPAAVLTNTSSSEDEVVEDLGVWTDAQYKEDVVLGTGTTTFYFEVQAEGKSVTFTVNTDKETVGDALLEHRVIAGDEGPYGLYVKTVNGILADYDINATYWNFTKNGEMMMTGVDGENVESGAHYEMVYTKG